MDNKWIPIVVVIILLIAFFAVEPLIFPVTEEAFSSDNYSLIRVSADDQNSLVYDQKTKIVYYYYYSDGTYSSRAYMCPYYSENGKLCRFNTETRRIEEIQ